MGNIINLADRMTKDSNRKSVQIGMLVDIHDSHVLLSRMVRSLDGFVRTGDLLARSLAELQGCAKLREGVSLITTGLFQLYVDAGLEEAPPPPAPVDDRTQYAALLKTCRDGNHEFGKELVALLMFLDTIDDQIGEDKTVERATYALCEALEITLANLRALDTAETRIFPSTTSEA